MPKWAEKKIKSRGDAVRWQMKKTKGGTMRCAVTRRPGPRAGKTVCYKVKKKHR